MERVVIKKETPTGVKVFYTLLGLTFFLISVGAAYFAGSWFSAGGPVGSLTGDQFLAKENSRLSEQVKTQMTQLAALQQELIAAKSEIELQKLTSEGLKKAVDEEMRRRLLLEKELGFYRKVSSKKSAKFLLSKISFKKGQKPGEYLYQFTIRKAKKDSVKDHGVIELSIIGKRGDDRETIRIPTPGSAPLEYNFKYFQAYDGKVSVGENFQPEKLKVAMVDKDSGKSVLKKTYTWEDVFAE
ncbi:MAG: hypothetical protein DSZ33_06940 [Gammaproteobacteria bacterium]|nr:MAG: hypothetical protein DSZ33_06940 [Gammaproteobacteria bacterium]